MPMFSERQGLRQPAEIRYRDELPDQFRQPILDIFKNCMNSEYILNRAQALFDPYNVGTLPRFTGIILVSKEEDNDTSLALKRIVLGCEWFQIYDLVEDIFAQLLFYEEELSNQDDANKFRFSSIQEEMNTFFRYAGIGWQVVDGKVISRGEEGLEAAVEAAKSSLLSSGRITSSKHLREAVSALSRRPEPDCSGAVYHAMGALECVARELTSSEKETLGTLIKKNPDLVPKPLDEVIAKVWGFASNEARHVSEGRGPDRREAELVVGLASVIISFINQKAKMEDKPNRS